ncbi:MAG: alpha-amylase family glycosyl hydrolase [Kiritimatiellia bacterium]
MKKNLTIITLALIPLLSAIAVKPSWQPAHPVARDIITLKLPGFQPGDVLHWAVTVDELSWTRPVDAYHPAGSTMFGDAVRTPFRASEDDPSIGVVQLGPFNHPRQAVKTIDFAISYANGTWNNNDGEDFSIPISAGRVTISPARPGINDPVVVTVHDAMPGMQLRWGVNADRGNWEPLHPLYYPPATLLADDEVGTDSLLTPPGPDGKSTITLGPFNRGEQPVHSLHMAVHWNNIWDTDAGRNYNFAIDDRDDSPSLQILHPTPETTATDAVTIHIQNGDIEGMTREGDIQSVALWLNGEALTTLPEAPFTFELPLADLDYGPYQITARTGGEADAQLDTVTFWHVPAYETKPLPEGIGFGATDHGDGRVTFALYAPGKKFVHLVLNGDTEYLMHASPDGSWWLTLDELEPQTIRYQYLIESELLLGDPYARQVDWTTPDGRKGWEPQHAKTIFHVGREPYIWSITNYVRPALDELVIYELYIEDFAPGEGFDGITKRLDYIADLGVNAIEPMPWHPWTGMESWGYNPAFHFAVEQLYGTPDQLKRLIDACHARGIAVIIDMVLNHAEWNSPLYQLYGNDYEASPYFRAFTGHNWGFPKIDQQSPAVKRYTADIIRFWIEEYHIDGLRYDATRWTGWQGYNDWGASWFAYSARQIDPKSIQIAEHLPIEPPLIYDTEMNTGWHAEYRWRIRETLNSAVLHRDGFLDAMDARRVGFKHPLERIPYTESHDEERVVRDLRLAGFSEEEVFRRAAAALAITLTTPGVPMIYAGQEFGEATDKTVGWNHLNWSLLNQEPNRRLHALTRELVKLRVAHPSLRGDELEILNLDDSTGLATYRRGAGDEAIYVAINFGRDTLEANLSLPADTTWRAVVSSTTLATPATLALLPGQSAVLVKDTP